MDISVVIPALIQNDKQLGLTLQCIERAKSRTKIPFELVIVETETNYLQEHADVYIWERKKYNCTRSFNRGFQVCSGARIALLTNDVLVSDGWLEALQDTFQIEDCGAATIGTTQFNHKPGNEIKEGVWCSVVMFLKKYIPWDENYRTSWDDTDMIMRIYLDGYKSYRNYNVIVDHLVGQTQYGQEGHQKRFEENKKYFMEKYKEHKDHYMYEILTRGYVI